MKSEILYQKTKTGAINQWRVFTEGSVLYTEFGQVGGKLQTTPGKMCTFTNAGRSNERTPEQQAIFEAESLYKQQLRLKYSTTIEGAQEIRIQPMLANDGHEVKFTFPVDVQRKYDGLRCMKVGNKLMSRGNKKWNVPHVLEELKRIFPEEQMTDGELYCHGMSLQKINSFVKKLQPGSEKIEYHIYDFPGIGTWKERKVPVLYNSKIIHIVETYTVNSMQELQTLHDQFVQEGYEGAIIRLHDGLYEFNKRSKSLLKWKAFEDKEFKIVSIGNGIGKYAECPIFKCKNDVSDLLFDVVPLGTMEEKKELFDNKNIGKLLTVKFIGRTEDQIPKFAVGKCIKE